MKRIAFIAALLAVVTLGSCAAGPQQLYRSVDDWDREFYVNNPQINGVLYFVPVIPLIKYGAMIGDFFVVNPYHFWLEDAWDGNGTNFQHAEVESTDGYVGSVWIGDGEFLFKAED